MATDPATPSRRSLPSDVVSPYRQRLASSTPHQLSRSSIEHGGSNSGTHDSVDRYVLNELDGRVLVDINDFAERWIFPSVGRRVFDQVVNDVLQGTKNEHEWVMPRTFSDREYLPWVGGRMREVCDRARRALEDYLTDALRGRIGDTIIGDPPDRPFAAMPANPGPTTDWVERLRCRVWAIKPGNMVGGTATRAVDIALSASPNESERWDTVLVLGEHKPQAGTGPRRAATAQLAGYAGEMFGVQPFRHYIPGFALMKDQIQLWIFDRMGCFASPLISTSTDEPESRRTFIELILAFSLMDHAALGFDSHVYGDASCTTMWIPPTISSAGNKVIAYIRLSGEVFRLHRILFIRPGLVCRGTRCFLATSTSFTTNADGDGNEANDYIVKMSWRFEGLRPEGTLLEQIGRNPKVCNVVRLHAYDEQLDVRLGVRKGMLDGQHFVVSEPVGSRPLLEDEDSDDTCNTSLNRVFTRTVLCDTGRSLTEAASALELLHAVRDSFIGHGTLYFYEHVLHRDISRSNILLGPNSPSTTGFLIDLDYAITVDSTSLQPGSSGAPHRTGTLPYMAIDILKNEHGMHLYHHDVESFLYVLIWCCLYDSQGRGHVPAPGDHDLRCRVQAAEGFFRTKKKSITAEHLSDPLAKWRKGAFEDIGVMKKDGVEHGFEPLLGLLRPGFDGDPVRELLRAIKKALFGEDEENAVLPSTRLRKGWSMEERARDEWILYERVRDAMDKAIRDLGPN
ncbi:hypothetical protein FGG08_007439 [Glutinoglossum americanum]|uniref:EKC/KEOPS complex subunit BUD32 n=1 Tax=Glutinoglossum americanum TaxID=1670608 RepID=A0A9P8I5B0_9PEZI|nr:hypothetical protein FGG08_007439 [Glutinoglossum americanum]